MEDVRTSRFLRLLWLAFPEPPGRNDRCDNPFRCSDLGLRAYCRRLWRSCSSQALKKNGEEFSSVDRVVIDHYLFATISDSLIDRN